MKFAGIPKYEIKNIIVHTSEKGLYAYNSGNGEEMHAMSSVISGSKNMRPHLIPLPKFQERNQAIQQEIRCKNNSNL